MVQSLRDGFRLGFNYSTSLKSATGNVAAALLNPQVIDNYLQSEVQTGRIQTSSPNANQPGKWHLVLDLSSPAGHSVNDGTAGEDYSLQHMKVDDIIEGIMQLGQGSLMGKFDVQNAYHIEPVHTEDRQLLGMKWRGAFYVDMVLPFGIRSAP